MCCYSSNVLYLIFVARSTAILGLWHFARRRTIVSANKMRHTRCEISGVCVCVCVCVPFSFSFSFVAFYLMYTASRINEEVVGRSVLGTIYTTSLYTHPFLYIFFFPLHTPPTHYPRPFCHGPRPRSSSDSHTSLARRRQRPLEVEQEEGEGEES